MVKDRRIKATALLCLPLALAAVMAMDRPSSTHSSGERIRAALTAGMDSLGLALDALRDAASDAAAPHRPDDKLTAALRRARLAYKSVEGLLEYFDGMTASILNGRDTEEADPDDALDTPAPDPVTGFAALDASFASDSGAVNVARVEHHALLMASGVRYARSLVKHLTLDEGQLFDAARLELVRVTTLGLGGFDARDPADRVPEAAAALRGLRGAMASCLGPAHEASLRARRETDARFANAIARLEASPADDFDAFTFIAGYLYPIARAVNAERRVRRTALPRSAGAWRASSDFIFDRNAIDPMAYASGHEADNGAPLAALGKALFFDPVLSGGGTRSCASCHHPDRAFTENRARTATIDSAGGAAARNTPTLINAGLQPALFADLRVRSLEDQVAVVVASRTEMRGNLDSAAARISSSAQRRRGFGEAFHAERNTVVTGKQIQAALAAYVRTLTAVDSRFDRAIRGDEAAMNGSERRGFNLFMGKARCGTCHFAPLFGGTMPPEYWSTPPEVIGVPAGPDRPVIDADPGRGGVDGEASHRFAFKTPTLRNVALTAPYMHNGVFRTLDEVVDFYDRGGGAGLGIDVPNQTLRRQKLGLTPEERRDIVAFLESLTDTVITTRPSSRHVPPSGRSPMR